MNDPCYDLVAALERGGFGPRSTGADSWESRCPTHAGDRRNLSITKGDDGRVLVHCHAHNCTYDAIVQALGLELRDLFPGDRNGTPERPKDKPTSNGKAKRPPRLYDSPEAALAALRMGKPTSVWSYRNADGTEALRVARFDGPDGKSYRPIHPTPDGWRIGDPPGPLPLYRLPEIKNSKCVYVSEGEKCADLARGLGLCATTSAHGAKSAHKTDWSALAGKSVIILPDKGAAGESYALTVLGLLASLEPNPKVKVVRLTVAEDGDDIDEWLRDIVPDMWEPEQCRAELDRLADAAPVVDMETVADVPKTGNKAPTRPRYKMTRAADVICRPVDWLWRDRVPRGMLTLFAGDPKLGKSIVTIATAAAVSRGAALPCDDPPDAPGSVIILSAEDDPSRTIVPRLIAAGADLSKIHILESVYLKDGTEALPSLRSDIDAIEAAVASLGDCRLIIIDPVSAYLGGTDDHKNAELRGVLSPLKAVAERTDAAVVLVSHLNKSAGTNGKHRVTGSIAYVGACRANFLFVRDRDDRTGRRVLMLDNGCNLAGDVPTLAYRIEDRRNGPAVEWEADPVSITAEQALAADTADPHERDERGECDDWLRETLAAGPVTAAEVFKGGRGAGFSQEQLKRAKKRVRATSQRTGFGPSSQCSWMMPDHAPNHGDGPIERT